MFRCSIPANIANRSQDVMNQTRTHVPYALNTESLRTWRTVYGSDSSHPRPHRSRLPSIEHVPQFLPTLLIVIDIPNMYR